MIQSMTRISQNYWRGIGRIGGPNQGMSVQCETVGDVNQRVSMAVVKRGWDSFRRFHIKVVRGSHTGGTKHKEN